MRREYDRLVNVIARLQRHFKQAHWKNGLKKMPWCCNVCCCKIVKETRFCKTCTPRGKQRFQRSCVVCSSTFTIYRSQEGKKKTCGQACRRLYAADRQRGTLSHRYIDGRTPMLRRVRNSAAMDRWKLGVFERDEFSCRCCGQRGGRLHAHHLVLFSELITIFQIATYEEAMTCEFLWKIENGQTLCSVCHRRIHKLIPKQRAAMIAKRHSLDELESFLGQYV